MDDSIHRYDDIIGLEHPTSQRHQRMSMRDRAAQFAPFAALTGYDAVITEAGRLTGERLEIDDTRRVEMDRCLNGVLEELESHPEVEIVHFVADKRKEGGEYVTLTGRVRNYDAAARTLIFTDGRSVKLQDVFDIKRL